MRRRRLSLLELVLVVLLLAIALPASTADRRLDFDFYTWGRGAGTTSPASNASLRYGGGVSVEGPFAIGKTAPLRVGVALDIESLPDKGKFSFTDLATFGNHFEVRSHLERELGVFAVDGGTVRTYALIFGGATFKGLGQEPPGPEPRRALRHYAAGLTLEYVSAKGARSWLRVGFGYDGALGPDRWRALLFRWSVELYRALSFDGRGGLGFGEASRVGRLVDFITAGLSVSIADLVRR